MSDTYFLYHSIGRYPDKATDLARAMADFAVSWAAPDDSQWAYALSRRAKFLDRWRVILGAAPDTVTSVENVTQGFHAVISSLPEADLKGRRVLIGADCFPSNHFLLQRMAAHFGFVLQTVPLRQGSAWVEDDDFLAQWTPDVGLALLTWVSSTASHRIDLDRLVAHGRATGSLIGVDITQGAGLLPFDVAAPAVDFVLSTSLKWMCGTPGAGVIYVAPGLLPRCQPELCGWFSQPDPFNWDITRFSYAPDIRRFDNGTPGIVAALASLPALDWHAGQDHADLLRHNRQLTARIIEMADSLNLPILTPRDAARRGGSVMVRLPDQHPAAEVVAALRAETIATDHRSQTLRLSPGVMTTEAGTEHLITTLTEILTA